jgi:simple sugar transport system permease protein
MKTAMSRFVIALRSEHGPGPVVVATFAVFVIFSLAASKTFPTSANMTSIGFQLPETALLGLGVMLSMVVAGIDLSVVSIADLAGVAMVEYYKSQGIAEGGHYSFGVVAVGILIALAIGAICGLINGFLIGKLGITAILATLATMELFGGFALAWTGGNAQLTVPSQILDLGNDSPLGIPIVAIVFVICAIIVAILLNGSRFGIRSILVGANPRAAKLSGIREVHVQFGVYATSGILASIAGIIFVGRTASATPDYGGSYILLAVVIAVLAGVDPNGGFGSVIGVTLAAFILAMIQSGFVALHYNQFLYEAAQGAILIIVLAVNSLARGGRRWWVLPRLRTGYGGPALRDRAAKTMAGADAQQRVDVGASPEQPPEGGSK